MTQQYYDMLDDDLQPDPTPKFVFSRNINVFYEDGVAGAMPLTTIKIDVDKLREDFEKRYGGSYI